MDWSDVFPTRMPTQIFSEDVFAPPVIVDPSRVIGYGSHCSVVFEGTYGNPPGDQIVAVKIVPYRYREIALKEAEILAQMIPTPENIIRFVGWVPTNKSICICLERYSCTLLDLIEAQTTTQSEPHVSIARGILGKMPLWEPKKDTPPLQLTPKLLELMWYVVLGLKHIHHKKRIHQGVTPQNILIVESGEDLCPKLSGMGIGCESFRWKAPELLQNKEPTAAMDIYSLGCVLFDCILPGFLLIDSIDFAPVFMKWREANLFELRHDFPEAHDLLTKMLLPTPEDRPSAFEVLLHPFFWDPIYRLSFLCAISDKLEMLNTEFRTAINNTAKNFLRKNDWRSVIDANLLNYATKCGTGRRYGNTVADLISLIRMTCFHYFEFPVDVKMSLEAETGANVEPYFRKRFPGLLFSVYRVALEYNKQDGWFRSFFSVGSMSSSSGSR